MKAPALRSVIAVLTVGGGLITVLCVLFLPMQAGTRDAAVMLVTLLLTQSRHVIGSLFREPPTAAAEKHDTKGDHA